jgi:hypothetical protein
VGLNRPVNYVLKVKQRNLPSLRTCYNGPHFICEEKKKKNITAVLCKTIWNFYKIHGALTK